MIDLLGYIALGFSVWAVAQKNMITFRWWHIVSCLFYTMYGIFAPAHPIFAGATLFIVIHCYHLHKLYKLNKP